MEIQSDYMMRNTTSSESHFAERSSPLGGSWETGLGTLTSSMERPKDTDTRSAQGNQITTPDTPAFLPPQLCSRYSFSLVSPGPQFHMSKLYSFIKSHLKATFPMKRSANSPA